jgi:hypothetical protein
VMLNSTALPQVTQTECRSDLLCLLQGKVGVGHYQGNPYGHLGMNHTLDVLCSVSSRKLKTEKDKPKKCNERMVACRD